MMLRFPRLIRTLLAITADQSSRTLALYDLTPDTRHHKEVFINKVIARRGVSVSFSYLEFYSITSLIQYFLSLAPSIYCTL